MWFWESFPHIPQVCEGENNGITELRQCISALKESEGSAKASAEVQGDKAWNGPCVLGDLCGNNHMPGVVQHI
jgi:hypothetical protein